MSGLARRGGALDPIDEEARVQARWTQVVIVSGGIGVVVRLADVAQLTSAELWVADLSTGRTWDERAWGPIPRSAFALDPEAGDAHALGVGARVRLRARADEGFELLVNVAGLGVEATLGPGGAAPTRIVTGESGAREPGRVMLRRHAGLRLGGKVRVGGETRPLEGASAMIELVDVALPRTIRWSSAALLGAPAAYLSDLGDSEVGASDNVAWTAGGSRALGAADLALPEPARPGRGPWTIGSRDGRVALGFTPRVVRIGRIARVGPAPGRSHAQVFGAFEGRVDGVAVEDGVGLCEARDWA